MLEESGKSLFGLCLGSGELCKEFALTQACAPRQWKLVPNSVENLTISNTVLEPAVPPFFIQQLCRL